MRISEAKLCIKELYLNTESVTALISERGVGKTSAYRQCADELGIGYIGLYAAAWGWDCSGIYRAEGLVGIDRGRHKARIVRSQHRIQGMRRLVASLLGRQPGADASAGHPGVSLQDDDNYIMINYSDGSHISLGQSPGDILRELKSRYTGGLRGRVTCKGSMYTFEVDLDSDDDQVTFLME